MRRFGRFLAIAALALTAAMGSAQAQDRFIIVASTTSTENSGLFKHILPLFKAKTGIEVRVIAQGTGQALDTGRRGDADVVLVHAPAAEKQFVAEGHGVERLEVMYNDFVIIGPKSDPAVVTGMKDAPAALAKIAAARAAVASRGDDSGTHKAELALWMAAGVDVKAAGGGWYRALGSGMGATLNAAAQMPAYALTDRASWISFRNRGDLEISVEGDARLFNQYGIILVNPAKHRHVKQTEGQAFIDWLVSKEGQQAIADYTLNGQPLFFPNAKKAGG